MLKQAVFGVCVRTGAARAAWHVSRGRLRILAYHGVCDDCYARTDWMPPYFVSASSFERQLRYLKRRATVLKLSDAVRRLKNGGLPSRAVVITFDDGYANNLYRAVPLLRRYSLPATILVASGMVESQDLFPFDKLAHLQRQGLRPWTLYKTESLAIVEERIRETWNRTKASVTAEQHYWLRAMTTNELEQLPDDLIEIGAHTHRHAILGNEDRQTRDTEIARSIAKVAEWTGRPVRTFSYPSGLRGDFDDCDKQALRSAGVLVAVSGISGLNSRETEELELRRYLITMNHSFQAFVAELTGLRGLIKRIAS
jgi:peptidoglycan/xylan/chitin deacetylase (PgdA/CDA1 family)